jgi:hypothetical protein
MQVFLPHADFEQTARVLDNKRLNKQALEGWQIMMTNLCLDPEGNFRAPKGWRNHPAVVMWRGHEQALLNYIGEMVIEWKARGYRSTIFDKAEQTFERAITLGLTDEHTSAELPAWMQDEQLLERITASHRTALLSKDYGHYHQFAWAEDSGEPTSYEYVWATN